MYLRLVRFAYLPDRTLGYLHLEDGGPRLATLERPWILSALGPGGKPREACVPDGMYELRPYTSARFANVYTLVAPRLGVYAHLNDRPSGTLWGRSEILIHAANRTSELLGCVAVGMKHGEIDGELGTLSSQAALSLLRDALGKAEHQLIIRPTLGTLEK